VGFDALHLEYGLIHVLVFTSSSLHRKAAEPQNSEYVIKYISKWNSRTWTLTFAVSSLQFYHAYNFLHHYRYAPHNDVSVNDGPHIRRWTHKIIILRNANVVYIWTYVWQR